jgi:DNA modification methylase
LLEKGLEETTSANAIKGIAKSYFDDMFMALKEQYRTLKKGGFLVYLLANSCYSELQIQTDLILCEIARSIGFTPLEITILKKRHRRSQQNSQIRESIVILRK